MNEIEKTIETLNGTEKTIEFLKYLISVTGFIKRDAPFQFFTEDFIAKKTGETLRATYNCAEKAFMLALKALYREQEREHGCEWCCDEVMFDGEDMELELQHPLKDETMMVYPKYCPMCGRKLED